MVQAAGSAMHSGAEDEVACRQELQMVACNYARDVMRWAVGATQCGVVMQAFVRPVATHAVPGPRPTALRLRAESQQPVSEHFCVRVLSSS